MNEAIIEKKSKELLKTIKEYRPDLDIKGKCFYVSRDGDDNNDGLSPETAWKTMAAVSDRKNLMADGDAVLFRAGDTFRGSIICREGITYSSYGEGEKPHLYAARENAAELDWQATESENVYCVKLENKADIGNIVFNHGESWGYKRVIGQDRLELEQTGDFYHDTEAGIVYLCCEEGNPSDCYRDIELCPRDYIFAGPMDNCTFDGLVMKYTGGHAIGTCSMNGTVFRGCTNMKVRGCEFEWIGGSIQYGTVRFGNAIEFWGGCDHHLVEKCYINQVYDAGITQQYCGKRDGRPVTVEDTVMRENLIDNCVYSYEYFLTEFDADPAKNNAKVDDTEFCFKNVYFEDNICRRAGYGFGSQRIDRHSPAHLKSWGHTNRSENFVIRNNIFDRGEYRLIEILAVTDEDLPVRSGNIYCQYRNKDLVVTNGADGSNKTGRRASQMTLEATRDGHAELCEDDAIIAELPKR